MYYYNESETFICWVGTWELGVSFSMNLFELWGNFCYIWDNFLSIPILDKEKNEMRFESALNTVYRHKMSVNVLEMCL